MDLHEFNGGKMYFDEPDSQQVTALLNRASDIEATEDQEALLLRAYFLNPTSFNVIVALYRFYYFNHRYEEALYSAHLALKLSADKLDFPADWRELDMEYIGLGVLQSMQLVRFYLLALKGAGYLNLRLGTLSEGIEMLQKVVLLDSRDRLGASELLEVALAHQRNQQAPALAVRSSS